MSEQPRVCSNPEDCCRELSRVWKALGVTTYVPGQGSASEQVDRLRAALALSAQQGQALAVLVETWRKGAGATSSIGESVTLDRCADELLAALQPGTRGGSQ